MGMGINGIFGAIARIISFDAFPKEIIGIGRS
jgi:hypothetical protein